MDSEEKSSCNCVVQRRNMVNRQNLLQPLRKGLSAKYAPITQLHCPDILRGLRGLVDVCTDNNNNNNQARRDLVIHYYYFQKWHSQPCPSAPSVALMQLRSRRSNALTD